MGILNIPNVTEQMRPWTDMGRIELPQLVLVLRTRADADGNELVDAVRSLLSDTLAPAHP